MRLVPTLPFDTTHYNSNSLHFCDDFRTRLVWKLPFSQSTTDLSDIDMFVYLLSTPTFIVISIKKEMKLQRNFNKRGKDIFESLYYKILLFPERQVSDRQLSVWQVSDKSVSDRQVYERQVSDRHLFVR